MDKFLKDCSDLLRRPEYKKWKYINQDHPKKGIFGVGFFSQYKDFNNSLLFLVIELLQKYEISFDWNNKTKGGFDYHEI